MDFIIRSVDDALKSEFGASISDEGVHILDPFTGTGTFIVRLLQSGLIKPEDLARKYRYELHANEIVLLAYYVAAINIEETYHDLAGGNYEPFNGIVLTDTFQMNEDDDELDGGGVFPENNERVEAQKALDIRVVLGNPPYSIGQDSGNDANQNLRYPTLDASIEASYTALSGATNRRGLYDSYIRAFRWASNRIGAAGIVCMVSNGGFIESKSADGLRKSWSAEFDEVFVFNLRGNALSSGEQRKKEAGNVFGGGSQATIAISLLIRRAQAGGGRSGRVHYVDIGDYLSQDAKLKAISTAGTYANLDWVTLQPNEQADWINQRTEEFASLTPLVAGKGETSLSSLLRIATPGVVTARDSWAYNFSKQRLESNMARHVENFNRLSEAVSDGSTTYEQAIKAPSRDLSLSRNLRKHLARGTRTQFVRGAIRQAAYRPFTPQWLYLDRVFTEVVSRSPENFPTDGTPNFGIVVTSPSSHYPSFAALAVAGTPDFHTLDTGQFFPRFTFEDATEDGSLFSRLDDGTRNDGGRADNVTDEALADYRAAFGEWVTKDDIFAYIYGVLHSPEYRERFAHDLKKVLPRIPKVKDFGAFAEAGRKLSELHLNYETVTPYPVTESIAPGTSLRVEKMRYLKRGRETDRTTIIYNSGITVSGIPDEAHEYMLGSRSALDWVVERYQVKTDKASGIVNDPNDWAEEQGNPRYILDLIARITTVSVETVKIVRALPPLEILE